MKIKMMLLLLLLCTVLTSCRNNKTVENVKTDIIPTGEANCVTEYGNESPTEDMLTNTTADEMKGEETAGELTETESDNHLVETAEPDLPELDETVSDGSGNTTETNSPVISDDTTNSENDNNDENYDKSANKGSCELPELD